MNLTEQMTELGRRAKAAAHALTRLSTDEKNACLRAMADALEARREEIQAANARDLEAGREAGLSTALLDRLELTDRRIAGMAQGLREVADLDDPVGRVLDERTLANGLKLQKVATPIGVIVIIFESRPNVTADAAGLCFKSGNATILRGGKEAVHSNRIIADTLVRAGRDCLADFPEHAIQLVGTTDRAAIPELLSLTDYVDLCMPRGGEGLIRAVADCSKVPVIKHYKGICSVFVDRDADPQMAVSVTVNSKCQRPGVCNAIETLYVDRDAAPQLLPLLAKSLWEEGVELRADAEAHALLRAEAPEGRLRAATEEDWHTEYLAPILNVRLVADVDEAVELINRYGSHHSDAIVTANELTARRFLEGVDSAAVYWNASTRFTDGGQFGMGAEIGISTDKVGARGPMGLAELTSYKWLAFGEGQIRR
jgi:glutamate-5-semialdehyde dehydrogenase